MFKLERNKRIFSDELISVIETGSCDRMKQFMNDHPTKHLVDSEGTHLLHLAAKFNRVDLIKHLIELKCKVNVKDSTGATPYKIAKAHNNAEAARIFTKTNVAEFKRKINNLKRVWAIAKWTKVRMSVISHFCKRMTEDGMRIQELGNILATCTSLCEVVQLNDPLLTKAVLQSSTTEFDIETKGYEKRVIKEFDLVHMKVLFRYGARTHTVMRTCLNHVLAKMSKCQQSSKGRDFFTELFDDIINDRNLEFLEDALMAADTKSIEIFLQYNFHETVKKKYGRDLLACLYGNRNPNVIDLLKNEDINVDGRGSHNYTPLHYAASKGVTENVKFLLERGADIDAFHNYRMVPFYSALHQIHFCVQELRHCVCPWETLVKDDLKKEIHRLEQCFKLLLQSGGNLLLTDPATSCRVFTKVFCGYSGIPKYSMNTINVLVTQVATFDATDTSTKECDTTLLSEYLLKYEESRILREQCRKQSKWLESHEVCDVYWRGKKRKVSMLTVLAEEPRKLGFHVKMEHLRTIERFINSYDKEDLHEYYLNTLEEHVKIMKKLHSSRDAAARFISKCGGISDPCNLIIERIVNYLNFRDLVTLDNLAVMYCGI